MSGVLESASPIAAGCVTCLLALRDDIEPGSSGGAQRHVCLDRYMGPWVRPMISVATATILLIGCGSDGPNGPEASSTASTAVTTTETEDLPRTTSFTVTIPLDLDSPAAQAFSHN